jgi:steroid delta-isomerase-like uncharacterized protein
MRSEILIQRWFNEVWNEGLDATVDELFAPDCVAHGLEEGFTVIGPEGFKEFLRKMRDAFPDVRIRVEETICEGDRVATRVLLEGTHLGDTLGIPRTGRRVSIQGMVMIRIAEGQIVEAWNDWDQLGMWRQLGVAAWLDNSGSSTCSK